MKFSKLILLLVLFANSTFESFSQSYVDSINTQLRNYFGALSKPNPAKEFNWDMAAHFVDSTLFTLNSADTLNTFKWELIYSEMRNSAYDTTDWQPFNTFYKSILTHRKDSIDMLLLLFDYYRFKPYALETDSYFNFDTINNILTDKVPRVGFPYKNHSVFAAAPAHEETNYQNFIFRIKPQHFFLDSINNSNSTNQFVRIDFGDGSGWHNINLNSENNIYIDYPNSGTFIITTEIHNDALHKSLYAKSKSEIKIGQFKNRTEDLPDDSFEIFGMNLNIYEPCKEDVDGKNKTLIYLEGLDILEYIPAYSVSAQDIYLSKIKKSGLSDLRNFGYRIIVVDWVHSRIDIRDNSDNLVHLLEYLKCGNIIGADAVEEPFVLMGQSMGGIAASLALLKMEANTYSSNCFPEKKHNVRLLITNDAPFHGAHIPISVQKFGKLAQNFVSTFRFFINKKYTQYFLTDEALLNGFAARQLIENYVPFYTAISPFNTYDSHQNRKDLLSEFKSLGDYPKECKIVAMSNGNLKGIGQTRYWDGALRQPGDRLLDLHTNLYISVLRNKIKILGADIELKTDPQGFGNTSSLDIGYYLLSLRLKVFGFKITFSYFPFVSTAWYADMNGRSTAAGGILELNDEVIRPARELLKMDYLGGGNWSSDNSNWLGRDYEMGSDGFHWNFIPVSSALNYSSNPNNLALDLMPPPSFLNKKDIVFDIVYGHNFSRKTLNTDSIPTINNASLYNLFHTQVINDTLLDKSVSPPIDRFYDLECDEGVVPKLPIKMLNREIGDNIIYLNNNRLKYRASFTFSESIFVNFDNPSYNYRNYSPVDALESVYSYDYPYIIDNSGSAEFYSNTSSLNYSPPYSGAFLNLQKDIFDCCTEYSKSLIDHNFSDYIYSTTPKFKIYPNPANEYTILNIKNINQGTLLLSLFDLSGKLILNEEHLITDNFEDINVPINLNHNLKQGIYIFRIINNSEIHNIKLVKK
jgi:hypothetical protein